MSGCAADQHLSLRVGLLLGLIVSSSLLGTGCTERTPAEPSPSSPAVSKPTAEPAVGRPPTTVIEPEPLPSAADALTMLQKHAGRWISVKADYELGIDPVSNTA